MRWGATHSFDTIATIDITIQSYSFVFKTVVPFDTNRFPYYSLPRQDHRDSAERRSMAGIQF